jgi:hypothetical protein
MIPGAETNLQQVAGTPLMASYPPAEIPPVIHNPYLKKIPPTPVQDTHYVPAGIVADQSPSSTRRQGPPPQQMHAAPHTPQASISTQEHQLDDYLVQSITSIDKHCQNWLSTFTRREGELQQQEQRYSYWVTQQDNRLSEWQHQLEAHMTRMGTTMQQLVQGTERQLMQLATNTQNNVQAWIQVTKSQSLDLHSQTLQTLQAQHIATIEQQVGQQMEDLQQALESFRSTARTLQVEWAQKVLTYRERKRNKTPRWLHLWKMTLHPPANRQHALRHQQTSRHHSSPL